MNKPHKINRAVSAVTAVALLCLSVIAGDARSQTVSRVPSQTSRNQARQAVNAVGLISVRNATDAPALRPRGSAVFISRDGLVATNYHVISFDSPQTNSERIYDELFITPANENPSSLSSAKRFR